jgi:hypothetical protein
MTRRTDGGCDAEVVISPDGATSGMLPSGDSSDSSEIWTAWITGAGQRRLIRQQARLGTRPGSAHP